ncbi:VTT domain-containing protein [candidate division WWE3 bacterium]|nr:VTT domain-containing protein [candidate division WWE3 bacterium]
MSRDLPTFIENIGYLGVFAVIFAESGLLIGFFLPGDSLIFTAGFLASPSVGFFNIWPLLVGSWVAAIVGDNVGYHFGSKAGKHLFKRDDSLFFHKDNLVRAQEFYEKHGGKTIVLARFIPFVRTFAPVIAGIGRMDMKRFMFYNFLGGTLWVWGLGFIGYFLGSIIPDVDKYLLPIITLIVAVSVAPPLIHLYRERKLGLFEKLWLAVKRFVKYKA